MLRGPLGLPILVVGLLLCAACPSNSQPARLTAPPEMLACPAPSELTSCIRAYLGAIEERRGPKRGFTGFVGVSRHGDWVFAQGYGKSDFARGTAPDADTRFHIGSVTKQFTAVAVMQLVESGVLSTDDPVSKYVPTLSSEIGKVTLHQLLSHSSGIASYTDDEQLMSRWQVRRTASEILATFQKAPLHFAPGTRFEYSNSNYYLLGLVIERATGQPYHAYLQQHLLGPAKMARSTATVPIETSNTAIGYTVDEHGELSRAPRDDLALAYAGGALRSTANDLLAWDRALASHRLLSPAAQARWMTPQRQLVRHRHQTADPTWVGYAYGVLIRQMGIHDVQSHGGAAAGFTAFIARQPEQGWAVIVLCNSDFFAADEVGKQLLEWVLRSEP